MGLDSLVRCLLQLSLCSGLMLTWLLTGHVRRLQLQRLRGRRGRREEADINIIDVNQDDIMPDRDEWMTKALTEETVVRRPQKSADDPTMQQRRKHQITYLAHQAKEREVELKNEWAQNRATKNAYRTKYGF
ncbi:proline-rich protein PRCC-like [Pollicipes pollicipes]|uniref:proline-rich protein PRCC-like n=1 Tax=Pollicipes pollicipes TaxID=41117 RepID=UPI0018850D96|nr:proline-rich protein PRCC-like [Pollicipes pollicipes]